MVRQNKPSSDNISMNSLPCVNEGDASTATWHRIQENNYFEKGWKTKRAAQERPKEGNKAEKAVHGMQSESDTSDQEFNRVWKKFQFP